LGVVSGKIFSLRRLCATITDGAEPEYELVLTVAGDRHGNEIPATITYLEGEEK
jgi:hypothetical protein